MPHGRTKFASNFPPVQQGITPEQLEQLKARAREAAIIQTYQQRNHQIHPQVSPWSPKATSCVRQGQLTVAEIGLMLLLSCGIVFGTQLVVNFAANILPRIEIKMK
jgi:hypothetical protein